MCLDISTTSAVDADMTAIARRLTALTSLNADSCRKLTPVAVAPFSGHAPCAPRLRHLSLQRCYQLTLAALEAMLCGASAPGASISALAVSHIDMLDHSLASFPGGLFGSRALDAVLAAPVLDFSDDSTNGGSTGMEVLGSDTSGSAPPSPSSAPSSHFSGSTLRVLALHSCLAVSAQSLASLLRLVPNVEQLLLGGCAFQLDDDDVATSVWGAVQATVRAVHSVVRSEVRSAVDKAQLAKRTGARAADGSPPRCAASLLPVLATILQIHAPMQSVSFHTVPLVKCVGCCNDNVVRISIVR